MVVGKTARTKKWVSGQQIDSFSDLEGGSGSSSEDEAGSNDGQTNGVDDEDSDRIDPAQDWGAFEELARKSVASSRTKVRTEFLDGPLLRALSKESKRTHWSIQSNVAEVSAAGLTPQHLSAILRLLTQTYPKYIDRASRNAVQTCLAKVLELDFRTQDGRLAAAALKWLDHEVNQKVCSSTSYYSGSTVLNLVCWSVTLFDGHLRALGLEPLKANPSWSTLVKCLASSFDALQASRVKKTVKQSGVLYIRAFVRKVCAF